MSTRSEERAGWLRPALIAVFVVGIMFTGWRGPYRAVFPRQGSHGQAWDFGLVYSLSRAWVIGANPYELDGIGRAWQSSGGPAAADPSHQARGVGVLVYPPTTLAALAPLGALPWRLASALWLAAGIAGMVVAMCVAARMAGLRGTGLWGFRAAGVWLAPFATNMGVGQTAVVTLGLIALGEWARARHADNQDHGQPEEPVARGTWSSGVLLGLATAIKPQMGLLFVVYEAGRMRWRSVAGAAAVVVLVGGIGVARLSAAGVPWWESWQRNLHTFQLTEDGNPTRSNPETRHHMLNLSYPLHNFTDDRELVRWLVYAIVGGLSLAYFVIDLRRGRQKGEGRGELVSLPMTSAVSLMVVYHRFYDAVLLVWPLALAVKLIVERKQRLAGLGLLGLVALFFVPGAVILADAARRGWIPAGVADSALWQCLVLPHEAWAILAMAGLLVWIRMRAGPEPRVN